MDNKNFKSLVLEFYTTHKRQLPWRETDDPYKILISEIMLQQTQISRVLLKYKEWLRKFPTIQILSESPQSEVLKHWSGLGYNRRALALHKLSKIVVSNFKGEIPLDIEELKKLPGIGDYTAKAVYTFSTNLPAVFIETNIRSVYLLYYFSREETVTDKDILQLVELTLDKENPREWYYALMDYGSWIKKEYGNPNKQSKTYTKQSKFTGSKRELRGKILKELHTKEYLTTDEIFSFTEKTHDEINIIIGELAKEGFIIIKSHNNTVSLR